jgi:hypothetical protein
MCLPIDLVGSPQVQTAAPNTGRFTWNSAPARRWAQPQCPSVAMRAPSNIRDRHSRPGRPPPVPLPCPKGAGGRPPVHRQAHDPSAPARLAPDAAVRSVSRETSRHRKGSPCKEWQYTALRPTSQRNSLVRSDVVRRRTGKSVRDRVVPHPAPRVTPHEPTHRQPATPNRAVAP